MNADLRAWIEIAAKSHRDLMHSLSMVQRVAKTLKADSAWVIAKSLEMDAEMLYDEMADLEALCYKDSALPPR